MNADPIIKAIADFNDGCSEFNVYNPIDADDEKRKYAELIGDRMEILANWTQPANTVEGAIAAIEFWREEETHSEMSNGSRAMLFAALGYLKAQHPKADPDPWHPAEHHARELARAMAAWPDCMRFEVTVKPHDADQRLFWYLAPDPVQELENLSGCIEAHRAALAEFTAVAAPADAPEEETQAADDAEAAAFEELLKFPCQTKEAKARKAEYIVGHLGRNRFSLELDIDQLETLLHSLI